MTVIYQTTITHIGACATMALEEQMLITFREGAPADIEEYCFIHNHGELAGTLQPGAELQLGEQRYPVTAVGEVAEQNLRELGHITLRFDGHREAEFQYRPCGGPGAGRHRARLRTEVCCLKGERDESGCCCHWRWTNLRRVSVPRAGRRRLPRGGGRYSERKPAASPRRLTLSMAKVWRTASAPTPPARPASPPRPRGG